MEDKYLDIIDHLNFIQFINLHNLICYFTILLYLGYLINYFE